MNKVSPEKLFFKLVSFLAAMYFIFVLFALKNFDQGFWLLALIMTFCCFLLFKVVDRLSIFIMFLFVFIVGFIWAFFAKTSPISDFNEIFLLAKAFSKNPSWSLWSVSKSPSSLLYYSFFITLLGPSILTLYLASILAWSVQPLLIRLIGFELGFSKREAMFSALLYTTCPAIIFFSPVTSTEAVFLLLVLLSFWMGLRSLRTSAALDFILFGLTAGASMLARPNAVLFTVPVVILISCNLFKLFKNAQIQFLKKGIVLTFALAIFPMIQLGVNWKYNERLSISSSKYTAWQFLVGSNIKENGHWNIEDVKIFNIDEIKNSEELAAGNKRAFDVAYRRIASNPLGFIKFALTSKLAGNSGLWSGDSDSIYWSTYGHESISPENQSVLSRYADAYMIMLLFLALSSLIGFCLFQMSLDFSRLTCILVLPILFMGFLHFLVEVQQRYHWIFYPMMVLLGSITISRLQGFFFKLKAFTPNVSLK